MTTGPILIIGLGSIGRRHLRNLTALGVRDIILVRTGKSTLPDDELAGYRQVHSLTEALELGPVAAVIANPTCLHLETAIACTRARLHVLAEKPVASSLERLDELSRLVRENHTTFLVGYQFRFDPGLNCVRQMLGEEAIGQIVAIHSQWGEYLPDWHPWEDYRKSYSADPSLGGGVALTLSHPLDYLRWLFGDVASLSATVRNTGALGIAASDVADLQLEFAGGLSAHVHLDYIARPPSHRLEIIGAEGTIMWESASAGVRCYDARDGQWSEHPAPDGFGRNTLFLEQARHFLRVIEGTEEPRCTLADGIAATRIALAAERSSESREAVDLAA